MAIFSKTLEKLKSGLAKSRRKINDSLKTVLTLGRKINENLLEELEEKLISDDIGVETTQQIIEDLRGAWEEKKISSAEEVVPYLKQELIDYWPHQDRQLHFEDTPPTVIMIAGVNGSGKTTSVGKLAQYLSNQGKQVVLAACDTFRAAAVQQLEIWSQRLGVEMIKGKQGGKASAVAWDASSTRGSSR